MSTGRLLIPTNLSGARVLYSDDHGANWSIGESIDKGSEPQVFERNDGSLCANLRSGRGDDRIMACSADGGETWGQWYYAEGLPDADTQASIFRFTTSQEFSRDRLLFSNPGAPYRGDFTIRMSYDEGKTWEFSKLVYNGAAGYSQLAVLSDHTILALFETGKYDLRQSITLIRVNLDWLTDGKDQLKATNP
jgi:sialidase-1